MSGTCAANMCKALGEYSPLVSDELKALNNAKWGLMWQDWMVMKRLKGSFTKNLDNLIILSPGALRRGGQGTLKLEVPQDVK